MWELRVETASETLRPETNRPRDCWWAANTPKSWSPHSRCKGLPAKTYRADTGNWEILRAPKWALIDPECPAKPPFRFPLERARIPKLIFRPSRPARKDLARWQRTKECDRRCGLWGPRKFRCCFFPSKVFVNIWQRQSNRIDPQPRTTIPHIVDRRPSDGRSHDKPPVQGHPK